MAEEDEAATVTTEIAEPPSPGAELGKEEHAIKLAPGWRLRRFLAVTAVYVAVWLLIWLLIHVEGAIGGSLVLLAPLYAITLWLTLRTPRAKAAKVKLVDRVGWQGKLIGSILIFLIVYLPFTFVSNRIIPFAPLVEYFLFAGVIFILYRLIGRSVGVAPSAEALPPASHRMHQQIIGAIDDPFYQKTVVLTYGFVENGKGGKALAGRLDAVLAQHGIDTRRRKELLEPLESVGGGGLFAFTNRGRARKARAREDREAVLRNVFQRFNRELESTA